MRALSIVVLSPALDDDLRLSEAALVTRLGSKALPLSQPGLRISPSSALEQIATPIAQMESIELSRRFGSPPPLDLSARVRQARRARNYSQIDLLWMVQPDGARPAKPAPPGARLGGASRVPTVGRCPRSWCAPGHPQLRDSHLVPGLRGPTSRHLRRTERRAATSPWPPNQALASRGRNSTGRRRASI